MESECEDVGDVPAEEMVGGFDTVGTTGSILDTRPSPIGSTYQAGGSAGPWLRARVSMRT